MKKNLSTLQGLGHMGLSGQTQDLSLIKSYYSEVLIPTKIEYAKGMGLGWDGAIWWSLFNFELGQAASMKWTSSAFIKYWGDWLDLYKCLNNKNGDYGSNWKKVSRINKLLDRANGRRLKTPEKLVDPQSGVMIKDESLFGKGKITYRLASGSNTDKTKDWGKIFDMILIGDADYKLLVDTGRKNKNDTTAFYSTLQNLSLNMLNPIPDASNVWNIYATPPTIDMVSGKWQTIVCPWYWNTLMPIIKMSALLRGSDWGKAKPPTSFINFMNSYDEELFMGLLNGYEEQFRKKYPTFTDRNDILSMSVFENMPLSNSITADSINRNQNMDSINEDSNSPPESDPDFDEEQKKLIGSGNTLWWILGGVAV